MSIQSPSEPCAREGIRGELNQTDSVVGFATYRKGGYVSVWAGNFADELDLDEYLGPGFEKDYGFRLSDRDMPEVTVEVRKSISALVEGFSRTRTFTDDLCETARRVGLEAATTLVVFYNFCFEPRDDQITDISQKPLQYLGAFKFLPAD